MTRRIAAPALLSALMGLCLAAPAEATPLPTYIALGDSLAYGETDFTHNPSYGDRGYVKPFADFLATQDHDRRPNVINLGVDAETSSTFFNGGPTGDGTLSGFRAPQLNLNYPDSTTSQNDLLLSTIASEKAAGHTIGAVSVNLGANDLFVMMHQPGFLSLPPDQQQAQILQTFATIQANYTKLLLELKTEVPHASLYLLGYHDPFAADPSSAMEKLAGPAIKGLNALIAGEATAFGAKFVDIAPTIAGHELADTYIASGNVHPNAAGYTAIAGALEMAAVPEPSTLAFFGAGLAGVFVWQRRRARVAVA